MHADDTPARSGAARRRLRRAVLALLGLSLLAACGKPDAASGRQAGTAIPRHPKERELVLFSKPFTVDRIFPSMLGPYTTTNITLDKGPTRELLWLTGLEVEVVAADGAPESIEYECHSNLVWPAQSPSGVRRPIGNVFTLTQGQVDLRLPPGFGVPTWSDEQLVFNSQVLNLNRPDDKRQIHHRARVRYVRDRDLTEPMKPLVVTGAYVMAALDEQAQVYNVQGQDVDDKRAEASCHAGMMPRGVPAKEPFVVRDRFGRPFTGHWVVKPGHQVYRTLVTDLMALPYDTTAHFIGVHVHPYSVSVELRDLTADATVWISHQRTSKDRVGLDWIDYYASVEGLPLYKDHQYELVSTYDNPTDHDTDAMASIFIYYLDKDFRAASPAPAPAA